MVRTVNYAAAIVADQEKVPLDGHKGRKIAPASVIVLSSGAPRVQRLSIVGTSEDDEERLCSDLSNFSSPTANLDAAMFAAFWGSLVVAAVTFCKFGFHSSSAVFSVRGRLVFAQVP